MRLAFKTEPDDGSGAIAARLGLIILQTDEIIENEFRLLLGLDDLAVHHCRITCGHEVTTETLARMEAEIPSAARLLPDTRFDVIAYACTSGATVIGESRVAAAIRQARPRVAATSNPLTAAKAALRTLGMTRIGFVTPYVAPVSAAMRDSLAAAGFETVAFGSFEVVEDGIVARMTPQSILEAVLDVGTADCDGVFVACTNLRAAGIIETAEAALGKPVVSSNQALAWHMLRLAGKAAPLPGRGRLFEHALN